MPITLGYWDIRGFASPMRMICQAGGIEYTEEVFSLAEAKGGPKKWFAEFKPELIKLNPCVTLPYIRDGNTIITLSNCCFMYLGRKADMLGTTEVEKQHVEAILFMSFDLRTEAVGLLYGPKEAYDAGAKKHLLPAQSGKSAHTYLQLMNECLKIYGTKFVGGDKISVADCALFEMVEMHNAWAKQEGVETYLGKPEFAELTKLIENVKAEPKLANFFKSDDYTKLPYNNTAAHFHVNDN